MSDTVKSRFLLIANQEYLNSAGQRVRLAYSARTARLVVLHADAAAAVEAGRYDLLGERIVRALRKEGVLADAAVDERSAVTRALTDNANSRQVRSFTIMPTSYCNMGCSYCGQDHRKGALRDQLRSQILERIAAAFADSRTERVRVGWFGGEPLLALGVIREMSERILAYANASNKPYTADVVTNGSTLTDRVLKILHGDCGIRWLEITLDGPQPIHDRRRVKKNGTGSYLQIVELLGRVLRDDALRSLSFGIRVNVDKENAGHVDELIEDLGRRAIRGPRVQLRLMPVHSWGNDVSGVALEPADYAALELGWLRKAAALSIRFQLFPTEVKRATCVATSRNAEVVDPAGRIYACTEQPLVPRDLATTVISTVGQLSPIAVRPSGAFDDWYGELESKDQPCSQCPFLPVCGGSCPKLWREGAIPCPSFKFNWPQRMEMAAAELGLVRV